jgi:hypothetical protein
MTADDGFALFVNGEETGKSEGVKNAMSMDITARLRPGKNVLSVVAHNSPVPPLSTGLLGVVQIEFDDGELVIKTDAAWRTSKEKIAEWETVELNDVSWS